MSTHPVVTRAAWLDARTALLAKEKAFTQAREKLAAERRQLPWVKVETQYAFDGPEGLETLDALFDGKNQLVVQHFMLGDGWDAGCPSCSLWADGYEGIDVHLAARDIAFVTVSNAPFEQIEAYRKRMGLAFKWVSSKGTDFNRDYHVSFSDAERESGFYNYRNGGFPASEAPGVSIFVLDESSTIYHTYSCYARGLDMLNVAYQYIDLTPKGRDEDGLPHTMAWLRRRDEY